MEEESMDVEFDPEFMRLYYNKVRTTQVAHEKKITRSHRGEPTSSGSPNFLLKSFGPKAGQLRRLRINGDDLKRMYEHDHRKARPVEVKEITQRAEIFENTTVIKKEGFSFAELLSCKTQKNLTQIKMEQPFFNSRLTYKSTMLEECSPAFLRMVFRHTGIEIDIFDGNSIPVLKKQIVEINSSHEVVRFQIIKEIIMREIAGRQDIRIPQIITSNADMKIYLCPLKECNEGFIHQHVAKNHALSHLDLRPYSCHFFGCGWTFAKESHLLRHLATHQNTKNYPCDESGCDKLFTTIYNLNEHKKRRHIQPATKLCPVISCKETFRNEKELRAHCKKHSETDAPLKCIYAGCKRTFFFQNTLNMHTKTHLEENQHICTYNNCNKIFQQAYRLKEHLRCHTGSKPYKCSIGKCTKGFTTASKLKRHEISHFDDKHHYCNIEGCDKAFKRSDHLNEHIRQVHKVVMQGGQKGSTLRSGTSTADHSQTPALKVNYVSLGQSCTEEFLPPKLKITPEPSSSRCLISNSEDEEVDLSKYLAFNSYNSCTPNCSNTSGCSKTEDELLDEAIKSLGVPEMKLETDLFLDEPLDLSDFSTVNLRDLH